MMVAKPPPPMKPVAAPKKPKKPIKPFDSMKKKVAVVIIVLGIVTAAVGFVYPLVYWAQQNAYSSSDLSKDQYTTSSLITYKKWDVGNTLYIHDTIVSIKTMQNNVYIDGVTYTDILLLNNQATAIGDHVVIELGNSQYVIIPGLTEPSAKPGDTVIIYGQVRMMIGKDAQNHEVRRTIIQANGADVEQNNMDSIFLGVGIAGIVIMLVGICLWAFFIFMPEDKEPQYKNIHEERKKEFIDQIGKKDQKKDYACPVCGLNMTYKPEFGKWYCEICNKLY
jgi:hypothetical protein